jgi:uncharacterized protein YndB with AHSA1/START domain
MAQGKIVVEATVPAAAAEAWNAYTSPDRIKQWNFASDDWHCPAASVDLREGGQFTARMEARDGSFGFDFAGTYTRLIENERIEYEFGGRQATVDFTPHGHQTHVRVTFDPESDFPIEQQRDGWQSILDNFARHLASSSASA